MTVILRTCPSARWMMTTFTRYTAGATGILLQALNPILLLSPFCNISLKTSFKRLILFSFYACFFLFFFNFSLKTSLKPPSCLVFFFGNIFFELNCQFAFLIYLRLFRQTCLFLIFAYFSKILFHFCFLHLLMLCYEEVYQRCFCNSTVLCIV